MPKQHLDDFNPYQTFPVDSVLKVIGDVKIVLNGYVTESCMEGYVLDRLSFALGGGSFFDCSCLGEAIILNQIGYTSHVSSPPHLLTIKGEKDLRSPFLMGIEKGGRPSALLHIDVQTGIGLEQFFERIGQRFPAYAFVGCFLFDTLSCTYLKKAPIFQESINENVGKYWATAEKHSPCYAYVFGVVVTEKGRHSFSNELLQRAFYVNPLEKNKGQILSHTHAALIEIPPVFPDLKQDLRFYEALDPSFVTGVRHVLTDSIAKEGLVALFELRKE